MTASSSIHFTNKEIRLTQLRLKFTRKGQIMHFETLQVTLISAHTFISNVLIRQFIQSERGRSNINSMPLKTWLMYHKQKIRFLVQLLDFKSKETNTNAFLLNIKVYDERIRFATCSNSWSWVIPVISKLERWKLVSALTGDFELLTAFWMSSTANWSSIASTMSPFAASRNHFKI